jgi:hypothetical protein
MSSPAQTLGWRARITLRAWMSVHVYSALLSRVGSGLASEWSPWLRYFLLWSSFPTVNFPDSTADYSTFAFCAPSKSLLPKGPAIWRPLFWATGKDNRPWRPIGLGDVETPIFSRQSAHRWRWGWQAHKPDNLCPAGRFLVLISLRGWVDSRAIVQQNISSP